MFYAVFLVTVNLKRKVRKKGKTREERMRKEVKSAINNAIVPIQLTLYT